MPSRPLKAPTDQAQPTREPERPVQQRITLPGAHADLGGGYSPELHERLLLPRPFVSRERYGTESKSAWSYRQAEHALAQFQREPWFDSRYAELSIDTWRLEQPRVRGDLPDTEIFAAIRLQRQVRGELVLVYLRMIHRLARAQGVPFTAIDDEDPELRLPDELQAIAAKLQAQAQGALSAFNDADTRLLLSRYVHL